MTRCTYCGGTPVAWRVKNDFGHWHVTQDKALADTYRDVEKKDVQPLYLDAGETRSGDDAQGAQVPSAAQIEAAWHAFENCPIDLVGDSDEEQKKCVIAAVKAALAAQPPAAPVETEASIIAERLRTLAACEDELSHDCAAQWLREAALFVQTTQAAQRSSAATEGDTFSAIHDALKAANIEYSAFSTNGAVVFGDKKSARKAAEAFHSHSQIGFFRDEIKRHRDAVPQPAVPVETAKHSPDECGRECQYYDYFEMLWNWFADESRRGAEDMRANIPDGLSADDFKGMLDEHESELVAYTPAESAFSR